MAIKDTRLKEFFSKQKVGAFDALLKNEKKPIIEKTNSTKENIPQVSKQMIGRAQDNPIVPVVLTLSNEMLSMSSKDTNLAQSVETKSNYYVSDESLANRYQTVSEPLANHNQSVSKPIAISEQTVIEPVANPLANFDEIPITDLIVFSKKERELLSLIFWQCRNNGTLISPPISTEEVRNILKISAERVRNLIHRIIKKGGLKILRYRSGQSAYRIFELPKTVYQLMIDQQNSPIKSYIEPLANPLANPLYSSSNKINTTISLPEDWLKVNHHPLESIGFSETQLRQLYNSEMTNPEIVQDAINRFAYSLEHNPKVKAYTDPLNVLMGVLRKGQRWVEPNYIPPRELALQQMVDEKRKQKEQRDLMIKELIELEFPDWKRKLTAEDIKTIVPDDIRKTNLTAAVNATLRTYFVENVLLPRLETSENLK